jgi:hypothetical protein
MRPKGLASVEVLGSRKAHGSRLRYMAGCKCLPCRAANSNYETMRAARRKLGLWNGLVSARRARRHMLALSRAGVGRRTVQQRTGIADSVLFKIRSGQRKQIRALTEKLILGVTKQDVRGSTHVPAGPTWQRIDWLLSEGFTRTRLAALLGSKAKVPALQLNREYVTADTARRVKELWQSFQ